MGGGRRHNLLNSIEIIGCLHALRDSRARTRYVYAASSRYARDGGGRRPGGDGAAEPNQHREPKHLKEIMMRHILVLALVALMGVAPNALAEEASDSDFANYSMSVGFSPFGGSVNFSVNPSRKTTISLLWAGCPRVNSRWRSTERITR